jgi:hypothetical protein
VNRIECCLASVVAAVLTVALTWPIAPRLDRVGRVDSGDGRYSIWNVAWVAHALTTNPRHLYDANIFSPHENTLAYSEANLVAGAIAVPMWLLTKNPYAASNWVILCSFVLSALTTYALVRRLTGSVPAAAVGAIGFAFSPFVFSHIPHVQLLMTFGMPLTLLLLHDFVGAPAPVRAIKLGAATALTGLSCGYYGIFAVLVTALGLIWFGVAFRRWRDPRYWMLAGLAGVPAISIVTPFLIPYSSIQFGRTLDEARIFSVTWQSYFASPMMMDRWMLPVLESLGSWREVLFPGFLTLALAAMSVRQTFRSRQTVPLVATRSVVGFYVAVAGLAFWASLGPDWGLYTLLHWTVPFASLLRAPARFGVLVTLSAAVLSGIGFANLMRPFTGFPRNAIVATVVALAIAKAVVGPLAMPDAPRLTEAQRRLIDMPVGVVAHFPYFIDRADRHRHTEYMLTSTFHWKPLINGYSDYAPADIREDMPKLAAFPAPEAWSVMRKRRTRYVLVHWRLYPPEDRPWLELQMRQLVNCLRPIVDSTSVGLYEIIGWPDATESGPAGPAEADPSTGQGK